MTSKVSSRVLWTGWLFWLAWWGLRIGVMDRSGAGLHVDEAQYWWWSTELAWGYFSKPPLIAALIHLSTSLFGDGVIGVRALGMGCWVLASALIWRWGVAQGQARAGWVAALSLAATPLSGILGLVVTTDGPLVLCWVLLMWGTWSLLQSKSADRAYWTQWLLLGVAFGFALLAKYTALIVGASWLLLWWWQPAGNRARWFIGLCVASALGLLILSPNIWWNAANRWPTLQHTLDITVHSGEGSPVRSVWSHVESLLTFLAGQFFLLGPTAWILGMVAWWRRKQAETASQDRLLIRWMLAFALPLLLVGVWQATRATAQVNWTAPALVGLCWGLGWWVARVRVSDRVVVSSVMVGVALSLVLALGGDLRRWFQGGPLSERNQWNVWARMSGWHEALAQLKPARDALDADLPVAVMGRTPLTQVAYEWRDKPKPWSWNDSGAVSHHFDWQHHLRVEDHAEILFVGELVPKRLAQVYPQAKQLSEATSGRVRLKLWKLKRTP